MDWTGYTVHDAANILRRYLNQLPEPIVPFSFYHRFRQPLKGHQAEAVGESDLQEPNVGGFDLEKTIKTYQVLITELPALNRQLLLYILDLLAVFASKSDVNRMTASNLSAIFQPGLLGLREHDMMPKEYRLSQDVLIFLIENQDSFLVGMQGTAADEKTIQQVQAGAAAHKNSTSSGSIVAARATGAGVGRTASNASAGAESLRKFGGVRRNVSTSSRRSRQSGHTPSPVTPPESPFTAGSKGGVHRSNTVPSKKSQSPALGAGPARFRGEPGQSPAIPQRLSSIEPTTVTSAQATPVEGSGRLSPHLRPVEKQRAPSRDRNMRMEMPPATFPSTSPSGTPSKERPFSGMWKQSPTAVDLKKPNKLQKKRPEGGALGAKSSNASLGALSHPPSPGQNTFPKGHSVAQTDAQRLDATQQMLEQVSENHEVVPPAEEAPKPEVTKESQMTNVEPAETSPLNPTLAPPPVSDQAQLAAPLGLPVRGPSPVPSHHSQTGREMGAETTVEQPPVAAVAVEKPEPQPFPSSGDHGDTVASAAPTDKKEKKHSRWRLSTSARREARESRPDAMPSSFGSATGAELSTSSVGSIGQPRKSLTDDSQLSSHHGGSIEHDSHAEKKGPIGWFKGKLQERKEREEAKERAKSPPPATQRSASESKHSFSSGPMPTVNESTESRSEQVETASQATPRADSQ